MFQKGNFGVLQAVRAAQVVPAWQPGCEKLESELENEEEMERKWRENEEIERE